MNLLMLRCFVETVRCGTMTEAARNLFMAQPNLSRQISRMEEELGIQLFIREHRGLRLTPAGSYLYDSIKDIPGQLSSAFERAAILARQTGTMLNIGILEGQCAQNLFSDRLGAFQTAYPHVAVNIEQHDFLDLTDALKSGVYDFILTFRFILASISNVANRILIRQPAAIAVHRSDPLAQRENLSLKDLNGRSIITLDPRKSPESYRTLCKHFAQEGVQLSCSRFANSTDQLLLLVEMGNGVALVDANSRLSSSPNVRLYPLAHSECDPDICIAYRLGELNEIQQAFLDSLAPL